MGARALPLLGTLTSLYTSIQICGSMDGQQLSADRRQRMRGGIRLTVLSAMAAMTTGLRCVIIPGNGCTGRVADANWYGWLAKTLKKEGIFDEVVLPTRMPDPVAAKESIWVPFIRDDLKADECTVVVGHSSGAEAAMRLAEHTKVKALCLVSACHTDLGDAGEAAAGYYARPWLWDQIRANAERIVQFHGDDDPFIPVAESRHVAENLKSEYSELALRSHFFSPPFPELVEALKSIARGADADSDADA